MSLAIAQGVGLVFGSADEKFFSQLYENEAIVNKAARAAKKKGA
jgi:hypothetical protein